MGADNLINFHKWKKYNLITKLCKILVFDRDGYKSKSIKEGALAPFKNSTFYKNIIKFFLQRT